LPSRHSKEENIESEKEEEKAGGRSKLQMICFAHDYDLAQATHLVVYTINVAKYFRCNLDFEPRRTKFEKIDIQEKLPPTVFTTIH